MSVCLYLVSSFSCKHVLLKRICCLAFNSVFSVDEQVVVTVVVGSLKTVQNLLVFSEHGYFRPSLINDEDVATSGVLDLLWAQGFFFLSVSVFITFW